MRCKECFEKPFYPNAKCCFSCDHKGKFCNVFHVCGEDCSHWKPKNPDIVEVVRCKECKYYEIHKPSVTLNCERDGKLIPMMPDDFCSYGKRKVGAENG